VKKKTCQYFISDVFSRRVHSLYSNKTIEVKRIPDRDVWMILCVVVGIEAALLLALTFGAELGAEIEIVDEFHRSLNYKECTYERDTTFIVLLTLLYASKIALIIWGVILSIQLRGVKYRVYNEASVMAFSMYNIIFFMLLGTIVQVTNIDWEVKYVLTSFLIILGSAFTVHPLFIQKVFFIWKNARPFDTTSTLGRGSSRVKKTTSVSRNTAMETERLTYRVTALTETVKSLREKYKRSKVMIREYEEKYGPLSSTSTSTSGSETPEEATISESVGEMDL